MHPLTTNSSAPTRDVHRFGFESASALEIVNAELDLKLVHESSGTSVETWDVVMSAR